MGLRSVTTVQGVSVTPHSSFFLDWAMHTTVAWGNQFLLPQSSTQLLNLANSEAKRCTLIVIHAEFTADQYSYICILVPCSTLWR